MRQCGPPEIHTLNFILHFEFGKFYKSKNFFILSTCLLLPTHLPHAHMLSHIIPRTTARQAPLSMDFSRQEYWSGLPFSSPKTYFLFHMTVAQKV